MEPFDGTARTERKLATILAADFVGYSALMATDEEGTARVLKAHRAVTDSIIEFHGGRIFSTAGDSVLAEFSSPVEAVRSAMEIQEALRTRNLSITENARLRLRIGINLGDVLIRGNDLLGDAVNVAARLEALAPPGGINISASVHDQVETKLSVGFHADGPQKLKNIPKPIFVFRVAQGDDSSQLGQPSRRQWKVPRGTVVAVALLAALGLGGLLAWLVGVGTGSGRTATIVLSAPSGHWLNGTWYGILTTEPVTAAQFCNEPDTRCRTMVVDGVSGDGVFDVRFGFPNNPLPAGLALTGTQMRIGTASNSTVVLDRKEGGLLGGEMTMPDGMKRRITMRKVQQR